MWARRSHLLQPLTILTSEKEAFKCTDMEQNTFDDTKHVVARNTLLSYPYYNNKLDIRTDYSDHQVGDVIIQEGKPISL